MNARGRQQRQLTRGSNDDARCPRWSPNGRTIVYSDGGSLVTISVRGGKKHVLGLGGDCPAWSPDGRKIAYVRYGPQIFVVNTDCRDQRRLAVGDNPAWSPDGKSIVFTRERKGDWSDIFVMDSNGHNQHALTKNAPVAGEVAWAPDGRWFAYAGRDFNLYVMPASGGLARRVDHGGHASGNVSWQLAP
jgi:TolB protein